MESADIKARAERFLRALTPRSELCRNSRLFMSAVPSRFLRPLYSQPWLACGG